MVDPILSSKLEVMKNGLISGLIGIDEIKNWADTKISDKDEDYFFIELSMSKDINEIISIVNDSKSKQNEREFLNVYFGLLNRIFKNNDLEFEKIISMLYQLISQYEGVLTREEESMIYGLDDGIDLANQKIYGSPKKIKKELKSFLNKYAQFEDELFN